jgi:hypothetical protein
MHKTQDKPVNATEALKFFDWAYVNGDKMADDLDYVPLPDSVKDLVRKQWAEQIKDAPARPWPSSDRPGRCGLRARIAPYSRGGGPWPLHCPPPLLAAPSLARAHPHRAAVPAAAASRPGPTAVSCLAHGAAWLTLALLVGIIVSLVVGAWPAIREVRPGLPVVDRLGSGAGEVRRPGDDLRHADDVVHRAADRRAGELRHRAVPDRAVARWLKRPLGIAIELLAAVPSIVYGMWGLLVFGPILATYVQQPLQSLFGACPSWARWFSGRRWASASCRPASSWRSWSSRSSRR